MECAEQKVKVPQVYCDSRAQTVCADVMNLPRDQIKALSPQVIVCGVLALGLLS